MRLYLFLIAFFFHLRLLAQLVLPGDYADPSVVKIGDTYWASATTSNWLPGFPLLKSTDLLHWETKGFVFEEKPDWADYYFWAPEISHDNGKVYIYYSAHKKNGNLCVGIASADNPEGPYKDHGPIVCQEAGSIDAFPMRDENGKLYLIWKEDGNSIGKPTPIWAMEMNEERTKLIGEKKELFRNDASWEGNLVEGVSIIRYNQYYYAFYSGASCCGRMCNYGTGIARARNLLGPWEKYDKNPVLKGDSEWKCPGHGTAVEKDGNFYFLYHAYNRKSDVYVGRQGLLKQFRFTPDGWIEFVDENLNKEKPFPKVVKDKFEEDSLLFHWQWSVFQDVDFQNKNGVLELRANGDSLGSLLGHKIYTSNYTAQVGILPQSTAEAGLGLAGDENNQILISYDGENIKLTKVENKVRTTTMAKPLKKDGKVYLNIKVKNGKDVYCYYSADGKKFYRLNKSALDGFFLPPWDRAVRVALVSKGNSSDKAIFDDFILINE